ncbi:hypothetical protein [Nonomuraea sp. NPDC003804]|uniref:hypothetical protein n=1 Tax=Nonomuraea sp. NPDC003804 TaxID=3154547 RepID=UPI0033A38215
MTARTATRMPIAARELIAAGERTETMAEKWGTLRHPATAHQGGTVATTDTLGTLLNP